MTQAFLTALLGLGTGIALALSLAALALIVANTFGA